LSVNTPPNQQDSSLETEWIALLGQRDQPTDGVQDYCQMLSDAFVEYGFSLALVRMPWAERGWLSAIRWLWQESITWRGRRVLLQYTALAWSRRGFPIGLLWVLFLLRYRGAAIAAVFHDPSAYGGTRAIDRLRRTVQHFVMRRICVFADHVVVPVNPAHLFWLTSQQGKVVFVPVGSNIPAPLQRPPARTQLNERIDVSITVFGITPGEAGRRQLRDIQSLVGAAAKCASRVHVVAVGRGTAEAEPELRQLLTASGIYISVLGLLPAERIGEILAESDVQIDVRAPISSRRGSSIAGIVCGTPVIGFESPETDEAIRGAGVVLAAPGDIGTLTAAITRILCDDIYCNELRSRNCAASRNVFSWHAISGQFLRAMHTHSTGKL